MLLTTFLREMLTAGTVTLASQPLQFEPADTQAAESLLHAYYLEDVLSLPHVAPAFDAGAAQWAAQFFYHTLQLAVVRELDDTAIAQQLADFPGEATPEAIYSVDLTFRYLPDLLRLAKGLAPGDALVARLLVTARQWPFSFVGTPPDDASAAATAETQVLAHPALRQAYIDRIIGAQDRARAAQPEIAPLVRAALGGHAATLWPDFAAFNLLT